MHACFSHLPVENFKAVSIKAHYLIHYYRVLHSCIYHRGGGVERGVVESEMIASGYQDEAFTKAIVHLVCVTMSSVARAAVCCHAGFG